jgi:[acyl-carrier-protein] S-malonyltransferase
VTEAVLAHEVGAAGVGNVAGLVDRVTADVTVPVEEVRAYYDRNGDLYDRPEARRISHVVGGDEAAASRVAAALRLGGGGAIGLEVIDVRRGELAGPLEEAIFGAAEGDVIGPLRSELGWHVARLENVIPAGAMTYAEALPGIRAELLAAARLTVFGQWLERRREVLAVVEPAFAHPGDPVHGFPTHRH